jgi:DUF4097 and DUF4098 domain-containing protein YvlB
MLLIKGMIKVAVSVIIIGAIVCGIGFFVGDFSFADIRKSFFRDDDFTLVEKDFESDADKININADNNIIEFRVSDDAGFHTSYYVANYYKVTLDYSGDTVSINAKNTQKWNFLRYGYVSAKVRTMIIEVPAAFEGEITVDTANGNVSSNEIGRLTKLNINTTNGDIGVSGLISDGGILLDTTNGEIELRNISAASVSAETTNGEIVMNNVLAPEISADTNNGRIEFIGITSDSVEAETTNGLIKISIYGDKDDYKIDVGTTNGDITVDGLKILNQVINPGKAEKISAETTNGKIEINFLD